MKTAELEAIRPARRSPSGGYTFVETLISLLIISVISGVLLVISLTAGHLLKENENRLGESRGVMAARYYIGRELNDVRPPWRNKTVPLTRDGNSYVFAWYKGDEGSRLVLENREGDLFLRSEEQGSDRIIKRISGQTIENIKAIEEDNSPYCLEFVMSGRDDGPWAFLLPLAVIPLGEAE